jgi:perosamine synthetase
MSAYLPSRPRIRRPPSVPILHWANLRRGVPTSSWEGICDGHRLQYTYSGRTAIYQYFAALHRTAPRPGRNVVLLPAFHCPTVVDPVLHAGYDARFYAVDGHLRIDPSDFLHKLDASVVAALFIRYFGFGFGERDRELVAACRAADVRIVEDCCHSFLAVNPLRPAHSGADATVYSFWKLVPSLVGGGLMLSSAARVTPPTALHQPPVAESRRRMGTLARQLVAREIELFWRALGSDEDAGAAAVPEPAVRKPAALAYPYDAAAADWAMPRTARGILSRARLAEIAAARRRNYQVLGAMLEFTEEMISVRRELQADTCPWGYPVLLRRRHERDYLIRARGVPLFTFGEVLHPLLFARDASTSRMLETARQLSDSILVFSVHQDLTAAQMEVFAAIINEFTSDQ